MSTVNDPILEFQSLVAEASQRKPIQRFVQKKMWYHPLPIEIKKMVVYRRNAYHLAIVDHKNFEEKEPLEHAKDLLRALIEVTEKVEKKQMPWENLCDFTHTVIHIIACKGGSDREKEAVQAAQSLAVAQQQLAQKQEEITHFRNAHAKFGLFMSSEHRKTFKAMKNDMLTLTDEVSDLRASEYDARTRHAKWKPYLREESLEWAFVRVALITHANTVYLPDIYDYPYTGRILSKAYVELNLDRPKVSPKIESCLTHEKAVTGTLFESYQYRRTIHEQLDFTFKSDKAVSDEPVSDEPVSAEPVSDEPVSDEPVSDGGAPRRRHRSKARRSQKRRRTRTRSRKARV